MKFETGNKQLNIIGRGTTVQGKVTSSGSLHVDGNIVGDITATDNVEIGVTGQVKGNVQGKMIKISGSVDGKIDSSDTLTFLEKAVVRGDIRAAKLIIEEGARFNGNCAMNEQTIKPKES